MPHNEIKPFSNVRIGEQFSDEYTLSEENISEFATLSRDKNPLHHDKKFAENTIFGSIIACGPHTGSLFMSLAATYFSQYGTILGLEFTLKFLKPLKPDDILTMFWEVVKIEPKESLQGDIISLEGKVTNQHGVKGLSAKGAVLVYA